MPVERDEKGNARCIHGAAIDGYRVLLLMSSLKLYAKTGIRTHRGFKLGPMLEMASQVTGQKYPRSKKGASHAAAALDYALKQAGDLDTLGADVREQRHHNQTEV